jgi:hypothetical protein
MVVVSFSKVDCNELPQWTATAAWPVDLGRGRRFSASDLQPTAVDFGKLKVFAVHFGRIAEDCGRANHYISMATAAADFGK